MRTIEKEMLQAIEDRKNWSKSNTMVNIHDDFTCGEYAKVFLFGNHIGDYWYQTGNFETNLTTLIDWPSVTTISRLRSLGVHVSQRKWKLYIDEQLVGDKLKYDRMDGTYKPRELLK